MIKLPFKAKKVTALLAGAMLTVGASGVVQAAGQAYAFLEFSNIFFINADTNTPLRLGTDITVPDGPFLQTGTNSASRDVTNDTKIANDTTINNGISVDPLQACIGTTCPGQNDFTRHDINTNNFVRADGNSQGSGFVLANGTPNPFTIQLVSEAIQGPSHIDQANSLNQNVARFSLTLNQEARLGLTGAVLMELWAELQPTTNGSSKATALFEISITDSNNNSVALSFPAGVIDDQVEATTAGEVDSETLSIPVFLVQTVNILTAGTYDVTLDYNTQVQLETVPEPGPLGLLGLGLLAAGTFAGSRRRSKQG